MKENQLEQRCATCHSADTSEVINTDSMTRQGWLCRNCRGFTKAVGRERVWKPVSERYVAVQPIKPMAILYNSFKGGDQ